jgi:hypothetical protein
MFKEQTSENKNKSSISSLHTDFTKFIIQFADNIPQPSSEKQRKAFREIKLEQRRFQLSGPCIELDVQARIT